MATANELATRALKRLSKYASDETPTASDITDAVAALDDMIASWSGDGVNVTLTDLPMDARFEAGIIAMLAVRLAEDYGATPGPVLVRDADRGWSNICAAYIRPANAQYDCALTSISPLRLERGTEIPTWKPATDYAVTDRVTFDGRIYDCTTAGRSAPLFGPIGTASSITDGSAIWSYSGMV